MKIIFSCLITLVFWGSSLVYANGPYTNSAHGNSSSGVDRTSTSQYAVGNCAHCHEQHASINRTEPAPNVDDIANFPGAQGPDNYLLFDQNHYDQTHNFCFDCHTLTSSYQDSTTTPAPGPIANYSYSRTFGGDTSAAPDDIKDAFALSGSVHNLDDILTKMQDFPAFNTNSNPCSGCHNPHLVQRNFGPYNASKSALSLPSNHNELWGDTDDPDGPDDENERMDEYAAAATAAVYRAPFYVGADTESNTTEREPDGEILLYTSANGSNLTNFVDFCLDCHSVAIGTVKKIDWCYATGNKHGKKNGDGTSEGSRDAPYTKDSVPEDGTAGTSNGVEDTTTNFVLSCMDCHEPHGSNNIALLRRVVNGGVVSVDVTTARSTWTAWCDRCHSSVDHKGSLCITCHNHGDSRF